MFSVAVLNHLLIHLVPGNDFEEDFMIIFQEIDVRLISM